MAEWILRDATRIVDGERRETLERLVSKLTPTGEEFEGQPVYRDYSAARNLWVSRHKPIRLPSVK